MLILFYSRRCRKRDLRVDRAYTTWKTCLLWYQVMMLVAMLSGATITNLEVPYIIIIKSLLMASHIYIIDILQLYKYFGIQLKFDTEGAV